MLTDEFDVEIIEFEGHGKSANIDDPYSLDRFCEELSGKVNDKPCHIFGYSMGGFVAMVLAGQESKNIKSITTLGTKYEWSPEIASSEIKKLNPDLIEGKVPAFAKYQAKLHGDGHWKSVMKRTADFMIQLGSSSPINKDLLEKIECPVQLILADEDDMVKEKETKNVLANLTKGAYHVLPGSKHPIERVDLVGLKKLFVDFILKSS